jgi:hypothetical protein
MHQFTSEFMDKSVDVHAKILEIETLIWSKVYISFKIWECFWWKLVSNVERLI